MAARTQARRRALEVLFQADVNDADPLATLRGTANVPEYAERLVLGVHEHRAEIDGLIRAYADRWDLERMPVVDRNLLRLGLYEILHEPDVPVGATVNDLVELAKLLSTPDSGRFVNGLLGRAAREHRSR